MSEKRLLYEANDGYLQVGATKYKDINIFIDLGTGQNSNWQETFNKVCEVTFDPDGNSGPTNSYTDIMSYPADFSATTIQNQFKDRENGGSADQKKGMAMDAVYQLLTSEAGNFSDDNRQFYYFDRSDNSNPNKSIACSEIKNPNPTDAATTWSKIKIAFDSTFDPWSKSQLLNCLLIGVGSSKYESISEVTTAISSNRTAYGDANNNKVTDVVDTLKANSCIPKFQFTQVCTDEGFCSGRVVCNSMTAENGGCDKAEPAGRFAKMPAEALGGDRFTFMNVEERYENFFDPSANKSKQCTRTNAMAITTVNALTSAPATGQKLRLSMERVESGVCDGEQSKVMSLPPMFMDFTKN
jgi:hypothetical protein